MFKFKLEANQNIKHFLKIIVEVSRRCFSIFGNKKSNLNDFLSKINITFLNIALNRKKKDLGKSPFYVKLEFDIFRKKVVSIRTFLTIIIIISTTLNGVVNFLVLPSFHIPSYTTDIWKRKNEYKRNIINGYQTPLNQRKLFQKFKTTIPNSTHVDQEKGTKEQELNFNFLNKNTYFWQRQSKDPEILYTITC